MRDSSGGFEKNSLAGRQGLRYNSDSEGELSPAEGRKPKAECLTDREA